MTKKIEPVVVEIFDRLVSQKEASIFAGYGSLQVMAMSGATLYYHNFHSCGITLCQTDTADGGLPDPLISYWLYHSFKARVVFIIKSIITS